MGFNEFCLLSSELSGSGWLFLFHVPIPFINEGAVVSTEDLKLSMPKFVSDRQVLELALFVFRDNPMFALSESDFWSLLRMPSLNSIDTTSGDSLPSRNGAWLLNKKVLSFYIS